MDWGIALLAAVVGYLAGSISFARIIVKVIAPGEQVTGIQFDEGGSTRHVGAISGTAVSMQFGAKYGGLTAILDVLKVVVPTLIFRLVYPEVPYYLLTAALGLVGHNWPLYYRFKGGMGLSAIYGGFLVLDFWGTLITAFVGMFLGVVVLKMVYISYLAGLWLMLPWIWFRTHSLAHLGYVIFTNVIFIIGIVPQIQESARRKRAGEDIDFSGAMDITPMGRMISKMAKRAGLLRDKK